MKKLIAILLLAVLAMSLTACGGNYTSAKASDQIQDIHIIIDTDKSSNSSSESSTSNSGNIAGGSVTVEKPDITEKTEVTPDPTPEQTPEPTEEPRTETSTFTGISGDKYKESLAPYYDTHNDTLGNYKGLSLLPGFDYHIFDDLVKFEEMSNSVGGANTENYTDIFLHDINNGNSLELLKSGCYAYTISTNNTLGSAVEGFTFCGCEFGDSEEKVLAAYQVEPDYSYHSTDSDYWSHEWKLNQYYTFKVSGHDESGLNSVELQLHDYS